MKEKLNLGEDSIFKLIVKYSVPAILAMLVTSIYNIADRAFIGAIPNVGPLAITGLGITMPIFTFIVAFGVLIGAGSVTKISMKLGEGDKEEAERYLGNAFSISVVTSIVLTILCLMFLDPMLRIFGASSDTAVYAKEYISVIILFSICSVSGFVLNSAIRADGNPKMAAKASVIGCIINFVLDPIFIFVFNMGIRGAAIATVITQVIIYIWAIYYFTKGKSNLKLKKENFKINGYMFKGILSIGAAPFVMELGASLVQVLTNNSLKIYGGDLAIGAMTTVLSIALLFMMPVFGIHQGAQAIIAYNYGAKKVDRAKKTLLYSIGIATVILTIGCVLAEVFPSLFIGIFSKDETLMEIAVNGLRLYILTMPILGVAIVGPVYFQSIGKAKASMILGLLRQFIIFIPVLLILPRAMGVSGVWIAQPIADIVSAIIIIIFLKREFSKSIDIKERNIA